MVQCHARSRRRDTFGGTMSGRSRGAVRYLLGLVAGAILGGTASAAEVAIGLKTEPSAIDPHFAILGANQQISEQIFDTLVGRDERLRPVPALATAWRLLDETSWEFKLREGVVFHDGTPFTAADAVFTIARAPAVPNSPASYAPYVSHIAEAVAVDDLTLRIRTKTPYPTLPLDLSELYVVSRKAAEHATTDDFNKGKAAIGTGPYRFVEWQPGQRVVLERNERYWGAKPAIERAVFRVLPSDPARVAALLAGDVALIEGVPPADLAQLRKNPAVAVWSAASTRLIYLHMDTARAPTPFAAAKQEFSIFLIGFGSATGDAANGMRNVLASYDAAGGTGANNRGRYSNPDFDRLLAAADHTLDPAAREKLLQDAAAVAFGDIAIIPIEFQANDWATRKGFRYHARMDESTTAIDLAPE